MYIRVLTCLLLIVCAFVFGQRPSQPPPQWWTPQNDAVNAAPLHHQVLYEDDAVRVLEVTILPGVQEPMHAHRWPSVLYLQSAVRVRETLPDGTSMIRESGPDGIVKYLPTGPPHSLENLDTAKTLHAIRVELKKER